MQHLDEGTIHAWLDGALAPNGASAAEAHVQACAQCAQAVAEARGLVAASSRILAALDDVPAVKQTAGNVLTIPVARRRSGWWWRRAGVGYAAAATALLAVGTTLVLRSTSPNAFDAAPASARDEARTVQPEVSVLESIVPPPAPTPTRTVEEPGREPRASAAAGAARNAAAKNAKEREAPKEELAVDRIVPLPGPMPRPATPPPAATVRQDARKSMADLAAEASVSAPAAVVKGRVLDAATGAPVVGAVVSVDTGRVAAQTDSAGKFQLQSVPLGKQVVSVRRIGFVPAQHQVQVAPRDSVELAFALQPAVNQLSGVVVTGAAAQSQQRDAQQRGQAGAMRERQRDPAAVPQSQAPVLRLEGVRAKAEDVLGCHTLRAVFDKKLDADSSAIASMPSRVELEVQALERAYANEQILNRARTLAGPGRAASWRFVGDSLELTWTDGTRRHTLRFARSDGRWISGLAIMEPCAAR